MFEHQIPGGQYSNLLVQCQSMGLQGEQWEQVLIAYRDVNELFGDIVKVTPSSKCVGDLALYLVTRGLSTKDLLADSSSVDFPESVVGLMRGELGPMVLAALHGIDFLTLFRQAFPIEDSQRRSSRSSSKVAPFPSSRFALG